MSKLTYQQAIELVRSIAPDGALGWTVRSEKNNRGDYGFDWTFSFGGVSILHMSVSYNPPKTYFSDVRPHCAGCGERYHVPMDMFYASHDCPQCPTRGYGSTEETGETGAPCRDADPQGWS